jgi:V8-like Glu-specific endopeptidase
MAPTIQLSRSFSILQSAREARSGSNSSPLITLLTIQLITNVSSTAAPNLDQNHLFCELTAAPFRAGAKPLEIRKILVRRTYKRLHLQNVMPFLLPLNKCVWPPVIIWASLLGMAGTLLGEGGLDTAQIVKRVAPTVVVIRGKTDSGSALGSGFVVSKDGKIVTNLHVIRDMKTAAVQLANGDEFDSVSILATDERRDLAILQVTGYNLPAAELGDSESVTVGDRVVVVGAPQGLEGTVTAGILSSVRDNDGFKVLQTDAAVNPGNSGGPLVDQKGRVIGVASFKLRSTEGLNFAVPINYARGLLTNPHEALTLEELRRSLTSPDDHGATSGPGLKQTLDWLRENVALSAINFVFDGGDGTTASENIRTSVASLDSCDGILEQTLTISLTGSDLRKVGRWRYHVPLATIQQVVVQRKENPTERQHFISGDKWGYHLMLESSSKNISVEYFPPNSATASGSATDFVILRFNDETNAQRVAKAFEHATELCRTQKEPF